MMKNDQIVKKDQKNDERFDLKSFGGLTQHNLPMTQFVDRNMTPNKSEVALTSFQSEMGNSILGVKVIGQNGLTVKDSNS